MLLELTKRELRFAHIRRDRPTAERVTIIPKPDEMSADHSEIADAWWEIGPAHAIERQFSPHGFQRNARQALRRIRERIAKAPDDEHDAAIEAIETMLANPDLDNERRYAAAYLAPHRRDWFEAVTQLVRHGDNPPAWWFLTAGNAADLEGLVTNWTSFANARVHERSLVFTWADALGNEFEDYIVGLLERGGYFGRRIGGAFLDAAVRLGTDRSFAAVIGEGLGPYQVSAGMRDAMRKGLKLEPALAARHFVPELCRDDPWGMEQRPALTAFVVGNPDVVAAAKAEWSPDVVEFIEAIEAEETEVADASTDGLPAIFASPPWENRVKWKRPVVELVPRRIEPHMAWLDGERVVENRWVSSSDARLEDWDQLDSRQREQVLFADSSPEGIEARRPYAAQLRRSIFDRHIAWFEESMHEPLVEYLGSFKEGWQYEHWTRAMPMASSDLAKLAIGVYGRRIAGAKFATAWLRRHVEVAATVLIPRVLSKERAGRSVNDAALRMLAAHDGAAVSRVAESFGDDTVKAIESFLAADPLQVLPSRMPALPGWLSTAELTPPLVVSTGEPLPRFAMEHIVTMLALSKDEPYAGLELVRDACEPDSLARFAHDLHKQWFERGKERKTVWACAAIDHFANDSIVPLIDGTLEGERIHDNTVRQAMDAFERVGTDAAMRAMFLRAQRITRKVTKRDAMRTLYAMAEAQGMTMDQLGDITIPRFDLDDDRTVHLDFGPRHFVLTFDEELRPMVRTEDGKPRATLPKPNATDDAELAAVAHKRFAKLKKEIKRTATEQRKRFEEAMVVGRRWTTDEFVNNFVDHPLMVEMVRRLVWGVWPAGEQQGAHPEVAFRMAEDGSWADVDERELALAADDEIVIGLAHPLELGDDLDRWRAIFDDYEIGQPFEQLERSHSIGIDESRWHWTGRSLAPVAATQVPYQRVLGLASRGWTDQQIGSDSGFFFRESRDGRLDFQCSPRFTLGTPYVDQTLDGISMQAPADDAHPVTISEIVRELEWLTRE